MVVGKPSKPVQREWERIPFELGRVVLNWGHIEATTTVTLWGAAGNLNVEVGRILTAGVPIGVQWEQIELLLARDEVPSELAAWWAKWVPTAKALQARRNAAVHGYWLSTGEMNAPFKALDFTSQKARKGLREDRSPGGSEGLRVLANEIGEAHEALLAWIKSDLTAEMQRLTADDSPQTDGNNRQ
jgi:hypothetical protein